MHLKIEFHPFTYPLIPPPPPPPAVIQDIPVSKFVPDANELDVVKQEMKCMVQNVLTKHITAYNNLPCERITHQYERESSQPTLMVISIEDNIK